AHTIAVSATGFSAPAVKAAKLHGISTRVIGELSDKDIRDWVETLQIERGGTACELGRHHLFYGGDHAAWRLDPELDQEGTRRGFEARIFADRLTGSQLSLVDLIRCAARLKDEQPASGAALLTVMLPPQSSMTLSDDPLALLARAIPSDGSA